jgi:hypothetical protein
VQINDISIAKVIIRFFLIISLFFLISCSNPNQPYYNYPIPSYNSYYPPNYNPYIPPPPNMYASPSYGNAPAQYYGYDNDYNYAPPRQNYGYSAPPSNFYYNQAPDQDSNYRYNYYSSPNSSTDYSNDYDIAR